MYNGKKKRNRKTSRRRRPVRREEKTGAGWVNHCISRFSHPPTTPTPPQKEEPPVVLQLFLDVFILAYRRNATRPLSTALERFPLPPRYLLAYASFRYLAISTDSPFLIYMYDDDDLSALPPATAWSIAPAKLSIHRSAPDNLATYRKEGRKEGRGGNRPRRECPSRFLVVFL